jgi:hypothetical protein
MTQVSILFDFWEKGPNVSFEDFEKIYEKYSNDVYITKILLVHIIDLNHPIKNIDFLYQKYKLFNDEEDFYLCQSILCSVDENVSHVANFKKTQRVKPHSGTDILIYFLKNGKHVFLNFVRRYPHFLDEKIAECFRMYNVPFEYINMGIYVCMPASFSELENAELKYEKAYNYHLDCIDDIFPDGVRELIKAFHNYNPAMDFV